MTNEAKVLAISPRENSPKNADSCYFCRRSDHWFKDCPSIRQLKSLQKEQKRQQSLSPGRNREIRRKGNFLEKRKEGRRPSPTLPRNYSNTYGRTERESKERFSRPRARGIAEPFRRNNRRNSPIRRVHFENPSYDYKGRTRIASIGINEEEENCNKGLEDIPEVYEIDKIDHEKDEHDDESETESESTEEQSEGEDQYQFFRN